MDNTIGGRFPAGGRRGSFRRFSLADGRWRRQRRQPYSPAGKPLKRIHLAAHFPGVNNTTVWTDPSAGSQIEFDSFTHLARTAERGLFDFFFEVIYDEMRKDGIMAIEDVTDRNEVLI